MPKRCIVRKHLESNGALHKIVQYNYPDLLKSNPFSNRIWDMVWDGCDWKCFSSRNYQVLKDGFVTEINQYRRLHGVPPLKVGHDLSKSAKEHAWGSCLNDTSMFKKIKEVGYLGVRYHLLSGNIIVRKMYDKFMLSYDWNAKHHKGKYDEFAQIIWKKTKSVGVGVCVRHDDIYVVIAFYPKGCIKDFNTNVQPIKPSHIHMFGAFGRNVKRTREEKNFIW